MKESFPVIVYYGDNLRMTFQFPTRDAMTAFVAAVRQAHGVTDVSYSSEPSTRF